MADMLYKAMKYMNAQDAKITWRGRMKKRERQDGPHLDKERVSPNKQKKGRQEIKTSTRENFELHSFEYPVGSSPHANKGWHGVDVAK